MKKFATKLIDFYHKSNIAFYVSLIGPLIMGTIHLVFVLIKFDWILINYCIFSYLMALFKLWQWAIEKYRMPPNPYVAAIISMAIVLAPMMAAFVLTIKYKDAPHFFFDWIIYAYALYGTLKMVLAIKGLLKKNKTDRQYVLSYLGLIGALYTMQMMEFNLIMTFGSDSNDAMYMMQLSTQGAIFLFSLIVIGLFVHRIFSRNKNQSAE